MLIIYQDESIWQRYKECCSGGIGGLLDLVGTVWIARSHTQNLDGGKINAIVPDDSKDTNWVPTIISIIW